MKSWNKILLILCLVLVSVMLEGVPLNARSENNAEKSQISVHDYQSFYQGLMDLSVSEINLTQDIILENILPINIVNRDLVINGNGYSVTEGKSLQSRIQIAAATKLTLRNLSVFGRNKYGTFSSLVGIEKQKTTIIFDNYNYTGPHLVYNPSGTTIFKNSNKVNLQKQTELSDSVREVGIVSKVIFDVDSTFKVIAIDTLKENKASVFWFRDDQKEIKILQAAKIDVDYADAFSLFYQFDNRVLQLSENATLDAKVEDILYGGLAFNQVIIEKGAAFNFNSTGEQGRLNVIGDILLEESAHLSIKVGGEVAPLGLTDNSKIVLKDNTELLINRDTGSGIFADERNHQTISVLTQADISSKQAGFVSQWWNMTAEINYINGETKVQSTDLLIDGSLDIKNSSFLHVKPASSSGQLEPKYLIYEKGITKPVASFYEDLNVEMNSSLTFESSYDEHWIFTVGDYETVVKINNVTAKTSDYIKVFIQVVDTTPPLISVYPDVDAKGLIYYLPVKKSEQQFFLDIGAQTDDGSPIVSDLVETVNFNEEGTYYVELNATDEYGNKAIPKELKIVIQGLEEYAKYIIQANDFEAHASDFSTLRSATELRDFLLQSSNAYVVDTSSNKRYYGGMNSRIIGNILLEDYTENFEKNTIVTHSGSLDYQKNVSSNIAGFQQNNHNDSLDLKKNSFIHAKGVFTHLFAVTILVVVLTCYVIYTRMQDKK